MSHSPAKRRAEIRRKYFEVASPLGLRKTRNHAPLEIMQPFVLVPIGNLCRCRVTKPQVTRALESRKISVQIFPQQTRKPQAQTRNDVRRSATLRLASPQPFRDSSSLSSQRALPLVQPRRARRTARADRRPQIPSPAPTRSVDSTLAWRDASTNRHRGAAEASVI